MKLFSIALLLMAACESGPPPKPAELPPTDGPALPDPGPRHGYSVSILPSSVTRLPGESQQFRIIVQGGDVDVRWRLSGPGDFPEWGTIDQNGLYRAPERPPRGPVLVLADAEVRGRKIATVSAVVEIVK
jgi:hypothetical protein